MGNVLTIFYSRTGKTRAVAEAVQQELGGDLLEIRDLRDRTGILGFIIGAIDVRKGRTTEIEPASIDLNAYDIIVIGSPIWGMKFAPAVTTWMDAADFSGKNVVLFATANGHTSAETFPLYGGIISATGGSCKGHFFLKTFFKKPPRLQEMTRAVIAAERIGWGA